ncbi:MAG: oligosaccharide flippase family protein [Steroidobacteraceae bacterium]
MTMKIVGAAFALLNTIIIARLLGARQYGLVVLALALANLCGTIAALGLPFLVTREIAVFREAKRFWDLRHCGNLSQIIALVASAVVLVTGYIAYRATGGFEGIDALRGIPKPLLICAGMAVPLLALNQVRTGILRGMNRVIAADIPETLLRPSLVLLGIGLAIMLSLTLSAERTFGVILGSILGAFIVGRVLLRQTLWKVKGQEPSLRLDVDAASAGKMLAQAPHFLIVTLLALMDGQISIYLLAAFVGPRDVGLFQVALQPTNVILMGLTAASVSVQPTVASSWAQRNIHVAQNAIQRAVRFSAFVAVCCGVMLYFLAKFIVRLYGAQFVPAANILRVLLVGQVIIGITGPQGAVLMMTGNQKTLFYSDLAFLTLKIMVIAIGIHYLGVLGAAIGEVVYIAAMRSVGVLITYRKTGLVTMVWRTSREH